MIHSIVGIHVISNDILRWSPKVKQYQDALLARTQAALFATSTIPTPLKLNHLKYRWNTPWIRCPQSKHTELHDYISGSVRPRIVRAHAKRRGKLLGIVKLHHRRNEAHDVRLRVMHECSYQETQVQASQKNAITYAPETVRQSWSTGWTFVPTWGAPVNIIDEDISLIPNPCKVHHDPLVSYRMPQGLNGSHLNYKTTSGHIEAFAWGLQSWTILPHNNSESIRNLYTFVNETVSIGMTSYLVVHTENRNIFKWVHGANSNLET